MIFTVPIHFEFLFNIISSYYYFIPPYLPVHLNIHTNWYGWKRLVRDVKGPHLNKTSTSFSFLQYYYEVQIIDKLELNVLFLVWRQNKAWVCLIKSHGVLTKKDSRKRGASTVMELFVCLSNDCTASYVCFPWKRFLCEISLVCDWGVCTLKSCKMRAKMCQCNKLQYVGWAKNVWRAALLWTNT